MRQKIGKFFMCFVPLIVSLVMQLGCGIVFSMVATIIKMAQLAGQGITEPKVLQEMTMPFVLENMIWGIVIYHVLALFIFALWYYFGCGKPKPAKVSRVMTPKSVAGTVIVGVGLEFFVCTGIYLVAQIFPGVIQNFEELMKAAGLGELTLGSFIGAVLLAPIGEEILCRGLIFHYAKEVSSKFWIANTIQALAFGIMHMNLVQGAYAFIMGLVLGVLYERFQSLYLCMLAHFVINASSCFLVDPVMSKVPEHVWAVAAVMAVSIIVWGVGLKVVGKPSKQMEEPADRL